MKPTEIISLLLALAMLHVPNSHSTPTKNRADRQPTYCSRPLDWKFWSKHWFRSPVGCQKRFVGFHGSCSDNKESLEQKIVVRQSGMMRQLGDRFYTTDSAASAFEFGRASCRSKVAGPDEAIGVPIVCSIFVTADKLPLVPKVFIPSQISTSSQRSEFNDENRYLYYNENGMKKYEKILLGEKQEEWHGKMISIPPVRFSTSTVVKGGPNSFSETSDGKVFDTDIQAAWSKEAIELLGMRAYCKTVKPEPNLQRYRAAGMKDWLSGNANSDVTDAWGDIYGSEEFKIEEDQ
ncbi:hypothetical protein BKA69DRAFT_810912 [Paraphysoderma sedebokerense]|nr:hypothetical protein BKA69DRAFT_810912 [Paraphysoderma sedebokerense]